MCHQPSCFGKLNTGQSFEEFEDLREERDRQAIDSTVVTLDICLLSREKQEHAVNRGHLERLVIEKTFDHSTISEMKERDTQNIYQNPRHFKKT